MKWTVVRYKAKPERADENQRLSEAVLRELAERAPPGVSYTVLRLADGTFLHVAARAEGKVLTPAAFTVAVEGDNGFVCMTLRGWAAPTYNPAPFRDFVYVGDLRAPICFDPIAARTVMPYYELRHRLGLDGKTV